MSFASAIAAAPRKRTRVAVVVERQDIVHTSIRRSPKGGMEAYLMRRRATLLLIALVVSMAATGKGVRAQTSPAAADVTMSAVALNVSDLARSEKFYIDVLGLERTFRYPADGK